MRRLAAGESCALVTDAGTPAISDPGADLVRLCVENDIAITAIPGCCAAIDALALSGLDTSRFVFEGFLPAAQGAGKKQLEEVKNEMRTLIFYEAPHRLQLHVVFDAGSFGRTASCAVPRTDKTVRIDSTCPIVPGCFLL